MVARAPTPDAPALPKLAESLWGLTVEDLKWYAPLLPGRAPTRKAELVDAFVRLLTDPAGLARLYGALTPGQQRVVAEVAHRGEGLYDPEVVAAKYPDVAPPASPHQYYGYRRSERQPTAFDLLFTSLYGVGTFIPADLAAALRALAPPPPPFELRGRPDPPTDLSAVAAAWRSAPPEALVSETERAVFHDLTAALSLIQEGKAGVSATTRLPTLATLRQLRGRLLTGDSFPEEYDRAEDAIRPFALLLLAQAAKWAAPEGAARNRLGLTKAGRALLNGTPGPDDVRRAWEGWLKSDLLDELSRVRAIKGQGAKAARLTKPAERRERLAAALRACPPGRWVETDEFFRYLRAERLSPTVERGPYSALYIGSSADYSSLQYAGASAYWDIVIGSYLRATLWEYAATLGLVEIAYTRPEESPHDFGEVYGLDNEPYVSRYDGLLGFRLTPLGAYVLGLAPAYQPSEPPAADAQPALTLLSNLDLVVTDTHRFTPNDRAFLERIGAPQSEGVYRLSRERILETVENGLGLAQIRQFLAARTGQAEESFPNTVQTFFADLGKRLGALREAGRVLVLTGDDPLLLTELAHSPALRNTVRLATAGAETVLLVPEAQEAQVRRQLKKLGYAPAKG